MPPAPAVQAYCYIPRIDHREWVDFLIDTGASETCLNGIYAFGLQSYMRRGTLRQSYGIGTCSYYHEQMVLMFRVRSGHPSVITLRAGIQRITTEHLNDPDMLPLPCLLGRDILNKWTFHYRPSEGKVSLLVP